MAHLTWRRKHNITKCVKQGKVLKSNQHKESWWLNRRVLWRQASTFQCSADLEGASLLWGILSGLSWGIQIKTNSLAPLLFLSISIATSQCVPVGTQKMSVHCGQTQEKWKQNKNSCWKRKKQITPRFKIYFEECLKQPITSEKVSKIWIKLRVRNEEKEALTRKAPQLSFHK